LGCRDELRLLWLDGRDGAAGGHGAGLPPLLMPDLWAAVQRVPRRRAEPASPKPHASRSTSCKTPDLAVSHEPDRNAGASSYEPGQAYRVTASISSEACEECLVHGDVLGRDRPDVYPKTEIFQQNAERFSVDEVDGRCSVSSRLASRF